MNIARVPGWTTCTPATPLHEQSLRRHADGKIAHRETIHSGIASLQFEVLFQCQLAKSLGVGLPSEDSGRWVLLSSFLQ